MEKIFYISKLVAHREYVLCSFGKHNGSIEWVEASRAEGYRIETTDRDEAQEMCDAYAEWNGSVECYERIAA